MSKPPADAEYSIAAVSKLTGVSCHALRVWERRYGFPVPLRSASGHRRYTHEQVQVLRQVAMLAKQGETIGGLITKAREGRLARHEDEPRPAASPGGDHDVIELVSLLCAGDITGGEACYARLAERCSPGDLIPRIIEPALIDTGERWFRRECEIYQERSASGFLRRKLEVLIDAAKPGDEAPSRTIVIGTVEGDRHVGGVLILHLLMERAGWRVLNLGVDLPVHEYQKAVIAWRADALGLSFVLSRNINKRFQELSQIEGVPIFVGGRSILNYQGLARRRGLIPIAGPTSTAIEQVLAEYALWTRRQGGRGE